MDLRGFKDADWTHLSLDRDSCQVNVKTVMNIMFCKWWGIY
jgi:hypothetical protein